MNTTDIANVADMPVWWPDYSIGIFYLLLGFVGAGIMVYFGEWDKLMGKSARILECEEEIKSKKKIAEKLNAPDDIDIRKKWEDIIDMEEKRLSEERKFSRNLGIVLYLFIGGVLASIIANSTLEAVAVGAGWTGLIGTFGIKKDNDVRREIRNKKEDEQLKEWKKTTDQKAGAAYYKGYIDAVKDVAKKENETVEGVLKKIGYEVEQ